MNARSDASTDVDVAIVGCGPVGAVAANFLGAAGLTCAVLERETNAHGQPRAFSCDDEALRIYQQIGLVDELRAGMRAADVVDYTGVGNRRFAEVHLSALDLGSGYSPLHFFHQPTLETTLRAGLRRFPAVSLRLGCEVTGLRTEADRATLELRERSGPSTLSARYVLACDGAHSAIRRFVGIEMHGARYSETWLAIAGFAPPEALRVPNTRFVCDPARPCFVGLGPANELRIEPMVLPHEDPFELERPEEIRRLIAPFVDPDHYQVTRAAAYGFGKHVAARWQSGPVFLLGDAAHQMPPFMGQGLVSGLRDVANLAWKLILVLRGAADPTLLDSYELERRAHAQAMIDISVRMGHLFLTRNPLRARLRDAIFGELQRIDRFRRFIRDFEFKPPPRIERGCIAGGVGSRHSPQGAYFPQTRVTVADGESMSDDSLGPGFAFVAHDADPRAYDRHGLLTALGTRLVRVRAPGPVDALPGVVDLADPTGRLTEWFEHHRVAFALVRPDRYVFGAAPASRAAALVDELARTLAGVTSGSPRRGDT